MEDAETGKEVEQEQRRSEAARKTTKPTKWQSGAPDDTTSSLIFLQSPTFQNAHQGSSIVTLQRFFMFVIRVKKIALTPIDILF